MLRLTPLTYLSIEYMAIAVSRLAKLSSVTGNRGKLLRLDFVHGLSICAQTRIYFEGLNVL